MITLKTDAPDIFWASKIFPEKLKNAMSEQEEKLGSLKKAYSELSDQAEELNVIDWSLGHLITIKEQLRVWEDKRLSPEDITQKIFTNAMEYFQAKGELCQAMTIAIGLCQVNERYIRVTSEKLTHLLHPELSMLPVPAVSIFASDQEEWLKKAFAVCDSKRQAWIAKAAGLSLCECGTHSHARRVKLENKIATMLVQTYPPKEVRELKIMSVGGGNLLQDYLLIEKLREVGYGAVYLKVVDPETKPAIHKILMQQLRGLSSTLSNKAVRDLKVEDDFHCIHAMDFEHLCQNPFDGWENIIQAQGHLIDRGVMLCSASHFEHSFFNAEWNFDLGSAVKKEEDGIDFLPSDLKSIKYATPFTLNSEIQRIQACAKRGIEQLQLQIILFDDNRQFGPNYFEHISNLLSKLFRKIKFEIAPCFFSEVENAHYLRLEEIEITEEAISQAISSLANNGILTIDFNSHWRNMGDYNIKTTLIKKLKETKAGLLDYALKLAAEKSIKVIEMNL